MGQLAYLSQVKEYLTITTDAGDAQLLRQIKACSSFIMGWLQRPSFDYTEYDEYRSGVGNSEITLRNWPVLDVTSVIMSQTIIKPAPVVQNGNGYFLEPWDGASAGAPQQLIYKGGCFQRGQANILVHYTAGYVVSDEAQTVVQSGVSPDFVYTCTPDAPLGPYSSGVSVAYANGTLLTKVDSAPAQGQYTLTQDAETGIAVYGFNAADEGAEVLLTYSYIPAAINDACITMVGERTRYRTRIGEVSHSLGGQETVSFSQKNMPDYVKSELMAYRKAFPL